MKPDYSGGGLVNLMASLVVARGGLARHPLLASIDAKALADATNVVLLIVDGLGDGYLRELAARAALAQIAVAQASSRADGAAR